MELIKLSFRNLYCFGNETQTLHFDKKASLNQIIGSNGKGKTTIMRIIKLLVYGETDDIKIDEIANDINSNGWGEIEFQSRNANWIVTGEFKSNANIVIIKDGDTANPNFKGKLKEARDKLKNDVVDMPYYIFSNVLTLSIHDFKSFINMNAKDSRNIRDRIFSFHIINEMMNLLRKQMYKDVTLLQSFETKVASYNDSIQKSNDELEKIKKQFEENNADKIKVLKKEIEDLKTQQENRMV